MVLLIIIPFGISSCSDSDDESDIIFDPITSPFNALVTVKIAEDGSNYLQLTDSNIVIPTNWNQKITEETRALCYLEYDGDISVPGTVNAEVHNYKKVLTKAVASEEESNGILAVQDPLEIIGDWTTVYEDGYLTLHFGAQWGNTSSSHLLNLVKISDNPLTFRLCHDKKNDFGTSWGSGIVAFKVSDYLPENDEDGTFTLSWLSFEGDKSVKFKYFRN